MVIGYWNGYNFEVSQNVVRGFTGLTMTSGVKTDDKESNGQQYTVKKSSLVKEMTMSVQLNAFLGCSVQDETNGFINSASNGESDYFYIAGKKLMACKMMLTKAEVSEIEMSPDGTWISAVIQLTMRQCEKDGTPLVQSNKKSSGSGSGSKKETVKTSKLISGLVGTVSDTTTSNGKKLWEIENERMVTNIQKKLDKVRESAKTILKKTTTGGTLKAGSYLKTIGKITPKK